MLVLRKLINNTRAAARKVAVSTHEHLKQWLAIDERTQLPRSDGSLPDGARLQPIPIERHTSQSSAGTPPFRTRTHNFN